MKLEVQLELRGIFKIGAGGGSRTHTPLRATDFESAASAIPPLRQGFSKNNMNGGIRLYALHIRNR